MSTGVRSGSSVVVIYESEERMQLDRPIGRDPFSISTTETCIERLKQICNSHQSWKDYLSNKLVVWKSSVVPEERDVLDVFLQAIRTPEAKEFIRIKLSDLRHRILVSLDGTTLTDPVLHRGWTWERSHLTLCREKMNLSPFDGRHWHLKTDAMDHLFARAILAWMSALPAEWKEEPMTIRSPVSATPTIEPEDSASSEEEEEDALVEADSFSLASVDSSLPLASMDFHAVSRKDASLLFSALAQQADLIRLVDEEIIDQIRIYSEQERQLVKSLEQRIAERTALVKQEMEEFQESTSRAWSGAYAAVAEQMRILESKVVRLETRATSLEESNVQLKTDVAIEASKVRAEQAEKARIQQEMENVRNNAGGGGGFCTIL